MSNLIEITEDSFNSEVTESGKLTLVDFWAPWCGPCRKLSPLLETIADEYTDKIKIVKVNTDENKQLAITHSISTLPSVLMFKDGKLVERMVGLMPKSAIISNITKHI